MSAILAQASIDCEEVGVIPIRLSFSLHFFTTSPLLVFHGFHPFPYGRYTTRQILIALTAHHKASVENHVSKLLLRGETLNALHQVLVTIPIARHQLPNERDRPKTPPLVDGIEEGKTIDLGKLEHGKHATGLEHSVRLAQSQGDIAEIPNAKRDRVQIDRVVGDAGGAEVLGVGLEE